MYKIVALRNFFTRLHKIFILKMRPNDYNLFLATNLQKDVLGEGVFLWHSSYEATHSFLISQ